MNVMTIVSMYVGLSLVGGVWNRSKGHGFWLGFSFCLLLTPLIGLLTVALAHRVTIVETVRGTRRSCPHCLHLTPINRVNCEFCGRNIRRQTVKEFLRLGELFLELIATVIIIRMLM